MFELLQYNRTGGKRDQFKQGVTDSRGLIVVYINLYLYWSSDVTRLAAADTRD